MEEAFPISPHISLYQVLDLLLIPCGQTGRNCRWMEADEKLTLLEAAVTPVSGNTDLWWGSWHTGSRGQWSCGADSAFPDTTCATWRNSEWIYRSPTVSTVDFRFNELGNRNGKLKEFCTDNVWIATRCAWVNIHCWNSRKLNVLNMDSILKEQRKVNSKYWLFADLLSLNKVRGVWCTVIWVNGETEF